MLVTFKFLKNIDHLDFVACNENGETNTYNVIKSWVDFFRGK